MRAGKSPRTAVANKKLASGKLSLVSTTLVQDELLPGFSEARSLENSSDQDENNVGLSSVRAGKRPRTVTTNGKPASGKLLLALTKLALVIG